MALHLITGYAGQEHITSADQGAYNMGTFGEGEFVLDRGSKFAATVVSNNQITIANGEALMQGRFIKLPVGTTESVAIDNGASGMKRKDLIVLRYSKDSGTGIESVALAVKKGTPSSGTPSDPSITTGTITDGTDLVNEMKLYRVNLDGLNITAVDTLFSVKTTMVEYMDEYQLPIATDSRLGGVKIGDGIDVDGAGLINLKKATDAQLGGVKKGTNVNIDSNGVLSIPNASDNAKGVVQIGEGLQLKDNKIALNDISYNSIGSSYFEWSDGATSKSISAGGSIQAGVKTTNTHSGIELLYAVLQVNKTGVIFVPYYYYLTDDKKIYVSGKFLNSTNSSVNLSKSDLYLYYRFIYI